MPDATVIGAGPAGCVAATLLARAGWDVTLVEQHAFPRDKVCGECVSALGRSVLHRLGVSESLQSFGPAALTHAALFAPDGTGARLELTRPMWGLSRRVMDSILLDTAKAAGVRVFQPARCESLVPGCPPRVTIRDLATNDRSVLSPGVVLVADGKAAMLPHRPAATGDFGIKAHFVGVDAPRDTIELFGAGGHYGGVAPIEGNRWNAAFSVPAAHLQRARGDLDGLFANATRASVPLRRQFRGARRAGEWLTSPLPRFPVSRSWPEGILPLGNAAAALEPIGGEGMGLAMRSAELAAEALAGDDFGVEELRAAFRGLWRVRRPACRVAARAMSSPTLAGPIVEWLGLNAPLAGAALRLMGKCDG